MQGGRGARAGLWDGRAVCCEVKLRSYGVSHLRMDGLHYLDRVWTRPGIYMLNPKLQKYSRLIRDYWVLWMQFHWALLIDISTSNLKIYKIQKFMANVGIEPKTFAYTSAVKGTIQLRS